MTYAINGFPSWSITSRVRIVLAFGFWSKVVYTITVNKKGYGSKMFSRNGNFRSMCLEASIKVIQNITILENCVFGSLEEFWQAWSCSKSWCIPNYRLSVSYKTHLFRCLIFEEFKKKVSKSGVSWPIAWEGVIKWFIRFFQNCAPWGTTFFYSNDSIMKESVY